jgi:hypothetical protein
MERKNNCIICGGKIYGFGHNAEPVKRGLCCDICNKTRVIPERLRIIGQICPRCNLTVGESKGIINGKLHCETCFDVLKWEKKAKNNIEKNKRKRERRNKK